MLIGKHDEALAQGPVSEHDVQHLKEQISKQNSVVRSTNLAANTVESQDLRDQVRQQSCSFTHSPFTHALARLLARCFIHSLTHFRPVFPWSQVLALFSCVNTLLCFGKC